MRLLLTNYNSIMVTNLLGLSENGVFSAAGKFAVALTLVSSCLSMAWQELFFSKGGEEDKGAFYTRAMFYYYRFLTLTLALLLPVVNVVFSFSSARSMPAPFRWCPCISFRPAPVFTPAFRVYLQLG